MYHRKFSQTPPQRNRTSYIAKAMDSQPHNQLSVTFLPFPTLGHMNLMIDTTSLFARHGVNDIIIATPANVLAFQKVIDSDFSFGYHIRYQNPTGSFPCSPSRSPRRG